MNHHQFQTTYLPFADTFYQVAWFILEDAAEAEDAVQELYLRLWFARDALDGIRNPKGYGITVLRNLCLDRLRRSRKAEGSAAPPEPETPGRQDEMMDGRERLAKVLAAIKSLPERQREVLVLHTLDGLSYAEIAERTGQSPLSLRVLLSKARKTLKRQVP